MMSGTSKALLSPSSNLLEVHLSELEEACAEVVGLAALLRRHGDSKKLRQECEAELWVSLTHLRNHLEPALAEWDRLIEELPQE